VDSTRVGLKTVVLLGAVAYGSVGGATGGLVPAGNWSPRLDIADGSKDLGTIVVEAPAGWTPEDARPEELRLGTLTGEKGDAWFALAGTSYLRPTHSHATSAHHYHGSRSPSHSLAHRRRTARTAQTR